MHMPRLILVTVLVLCACICAAAQQSSYNVNDDNLAMHGSYGDKTGRRLQQGSGLTAAAADDDDNKNLEFFIAGCVIFALNVLYNACIKSFFSTKKLADGRQVYDLDKNQRRVALLAAASFIVGLMCPFFDFDTIASVSFFILTLMYTGANVALEWAKADGDSV